MQRRGQITASPSLTAPQPSQDFADRKGGLGRAASGTLWPAALPGKAALGTVFNSPSALPSAELVSSQPNPDRENALSILVQPFYPGVPLLPEGFYPPETGTQSKHGQGRLPREVPMLCLSSAHGVQAALRDSACLPASPLCTKRGLCPQLVGDIFSSSISPPVPVMSAATETTRRADFSFPGSQLPTSLNSLLASHCAQRRRKSDKAPCACQDTGTEQN